MTRQFVSQVMARSAYVRLNSGTCPEMRDGFDRNHGPLRLVFGDGWATA